MTRCFLSFATRAFVSRYFSARNGQSKRFTLVSMIPTAAEEVAASGATVCAASKRWPANETAVALANELFKKLRRSIGFMCKRDVEWLGQSKFNFHSFLAEDGRTNSSEVPAKNLHSIGF